MQDIFEVCPVIENARFRLRLVSREDCAGLLAVYADDAAVPFFNSDNCNGDDFHYTTPERMMEAIDFWLREYAARYYIRWTILDSTAEELRILGTVEYFTRYSDSDSFDNCGILRLDLRSDCENTETISALLDLLVPELFRYFPGDKMATKAIPAARERVQALSQAGFTHSEEKLIGHGGVEYDSYWVKTK